MLFLAGSVAVAVSALETCAAEITRAVPSAAKPGETIKVTFTGDQLGRVTNLWTAFPSCSELVKASAKEAVFRVALGSNVPVQIAPVRLIGSNTLSELHLMMVDDLPTVQKTNATAKNPQPLAGDSAVEGTTSELQSDYFTFKAQRKENVSVEVVARRLGSNLDPLLRILDQNTNELVYSLAYNEPNGDPKIRFTAPKAGIYTIELRDISYRGGSKFFYRLRLGNFPLVTAPFPAVVQIGHATELKFTGSAVAGAMMTGRLEIPTNSPVDELSWTPVAARFRNARGSGFAEVLQSMMTQITETEPNDKIEQGTKVRVPTGVNGKFEKARDKDYYEFTLEKGERIHCTGRTRSLGVPCDLTMQLFDADGKQVAETKNTGADEGLLTARAEQSGLYRLLVEELTGAGRADFVYHVEISKPAARFSLSVADDRAEWSTNNSLLVKISCARNGYDGPVTLSAKGLEQVRLENTIIEEKKTNTTVKIMLPQGEEVERFLQIFGTAKGDKETVRASTMPAFRKTFPNILYSSEPLDGLIWIAPR